MQRYDEDMLVVEGRYTLIINGERLPLNPGQEYLIAISVVHAGEDLAETRTIQPFGDYRADRDLKQ